MDSQQYVLKSCTIAKRVYYPGTRTLFFCTTGPVPETFLLLLLNAELMSRFYLEF